ncbi:transposase [Variovorax sp. RTB1]|jgi:transposase|uniref:transposase n=1 Tax=Variovorax sp. RTB1 TaxID=3048631 RepID=UPI002B2265C4|nr:transposase [Variovorax sp. RTB1]MEB0114788.1 transposase [Variovorax sp. RTB1]
MEKYETEFKLQVVNSFLEGEGGAKLLARRWNVPEEKIRTWVSRYRLHGIDGLRPKRSAYSSEFKLQVLSHQNRERLSSRRVAAIYDIRNPNQVVVWRRDLAEGDAQDLGNTMPKPDTKPEQHCSDTSPKAVPDSADACAKRARGCARRSRT